MIFGFSADVVRETRKGAGLSYSASARQCTFLTEIFLDRDLAKGAAAGWQISFEKVHCLTGNRVAEAGALPRFRTTSALKPNPRILAKERIHNLPQVTDQQAPALGTPPLQRTV